MLTGSRQNAEKVGRLSFAIERRLLARRSKNLGFTTLVRLKKTISGDFVCFRTYGRAGSLTP